MKGGSLTRPRNFQQKSLVQEDRPSLFRGMEMAALFGVVATVFLFIQSFPGLPDQIPIHFNAAGKPDSYGSKWVLLLLPALSVLLYIGLSVLNRFPQLFNFPWRITEENYARQVALAQTLIVAVKAEILLFFAYLEWGTIQIAHGKMERLSPSLFIIFLLLIFGSIGIYFVQSYRER